MRNWKWSEISKYLDGLTKEELKNVDPFTFGDLSFGQIYLLRKNIEARLFM